MTPDKSSRNKLFVEGADDFHVICALAKKHGIGLSPSDPRLPFWEKTNGDRATLKGARLAVKALLPRVGLVLDADSNPGARWAMIRHEFEGLGDSPWSIELPHAYSPEGVVVDGDGGLRLGVWLMPGGNQPGAVEAFLASLVPRDDLWTHAEHATLAARQKGATFGDKDLDKARLRAWLAWQKTPGATYGRAIDERYFRSSSVEAEALVSWFRKLFGFE